MIRNSPTTGTTARRTPPPDLQRLLIAGMRDAVARAVRTGRDLADADADDLRRLRDELGRVLDVLAVERGGDSYHTDRAEAAMILDDLAERHLLLNGPLQWPGDEPSVAVEPAAEHRPAPAPRELSVTVTVREVPAP
jgi:hypothetical protein